MLAYKQNIVLFPQRQPEITVHKVQAAPITAPAADANPGIPLNEAPPEAWRQAIIPDLHAAAAHHAEPSSSLFRAIVALCLLHLKSKARIGWLHRVTGFGTGELSMFLYRARAGGIILRDDSACGQPDISDEFAFEVSCVIDAMVLDGQLTRDRHGLYRLGDHFTQHPASRAAR